VPDNPSGWEPKVGDRVRIRSAGDLPAEVIEVVEREGGREYVVEPDPAAITRQPGDAEGFHRLERRIFPLDELAPDPSTEDAT
jgi:hypothetical protein